MVHVEHNAPDPDRDDDRPRRMRSSQARNGRRTTGSDDRQQRQHADHHAEGVSGRKRRRVRGDQRRGGRGRLAASLAISVMSPLSSTLITRNNATRRLRRTSATTITTRASSRNDGRPEHGAEHIPGRHPAGVCDAVAMQRVQPRTSRWSSASSTATHSRSTSAHTPRRARAADPIEPGLPRCHLTSCTTCIALEAAGAVG